LICLKSCACALPSIACHAALFTFPSRFRHPAFTLLDVLVVMVILGLLAGSGAPKYFA
jgi:type II secretory pathway pseudopilin PulG